MATFRRWLLRGTLGTITLVLLAGAVGTLWEGAQRRGVPERYPAPGEMVDLGTHRLHVRRFGTGPVTVVLDAGSGNYGSLAYRSVERDLVQFASVIAYDRAGTNWSDPGPPPRSAIRIADELHAALEQLEVTGPLVLVGHSQGGINMIQFARKYRDQVAGVVLVDAPMPNSAAEMPAEARALLMPGPIGRRMMGIMARTGLMRLTMPPEAAGLPGPSGDADLAKANAALAAFFPSVFQHGLMTEFHDNTNTVTVEFQPQMLDSLPVTILSSSFLPPRSELGPGWSDELYQSMLTYWERTQEQLRGLSTLSKRVVVPHSTHFLQHSNPDVVVGAIRDLVTLAGRRPLVTAVPTGT